MLPGAPVVSIKTYVEFSVCKPGVGGAVGVEGGVPVPLTVGVSVRVPDGEVDGSAPVEGVPVWVLLELGGAGVEELVLVKVTEGVTEGVRDPEGVPVMEAVAENVGDGVTV